MDANVTQKTSRVREILLANVAGVQLPRMNQQMVLQVATFRKRFLTEMALEFLSLGVCHDVTFENLDGGSVNRKLLNEN